MRPLRQQGPMRLPEGPQRHEQLTRWPDALHPDVQGSEQASLRQVHERRGLPMRGLLTGDLYPQCPKCKKFHDPYAPCAPD